MAAQGQSCRRLPTLGGRWRFQMDWLEGSNCDVLCPCDFRDGPSHGNCEAFLGWQIRTESFRGVRLDGVKFCWGIWGPKSIRDGSGTVHLYVDTEVTDRQHTAVEEITSGRHDGGVFESFPKTFTKVLPPKTADIDFRYQGYNTRFSVADVGFVRLHATTSPEVGEEFRGEAKSPKGKIWRRALIAHTDWSLHDDGFQMDHANWWGAATVTRYIETGPVSSGRAVRRLTAAGGR